MREARATWKTGGTLTPIFVVAVAFTITAISLLLLLASVSYCPLKRVAGETGEWCCHHKDEKVSMHACHLITPFPRSWQRFWAGHARVVWLFCLFKSQWGGGARSGPGTTEIYLGLSTNTLQWFSKAQNVLARAGSVFSIICFFSLPCTAANGNSLWIYSRTCLQEFFSKNAEALICFLAAIYFFIPQSM